MGGTDTEMGASWEVGSAPSWLHVPQPTGSLNSTDSYGRFEVSATTSGQPGRQAPYESVFNVSTISGINRAFTVPVLLYVTATTVDAAWGAADSSLSCLNTTAPHASAIAGSIMQIPFLGCDRDGLVNARNANFSAIARRQGAPDMPLPVEYDDVLGAFQATFQAALPDTYTLLLFLSGDPVATPLSIVARGCPDGL